MKPLLSLSNLERLEEIKKEIKSLLISQCNQNVTLHQLSILYKEEIGDDLPFKDFNHTSLKEFLSSIPDTVSLSFDEKNKLCVRHVESDKTRHLSSLIARQKSNKKPKKPECKRKLHSNFIDPMILKRAMLKLLSSSTNKSCIKKVHLLSEIKTSIGVLSFYTIQDLNVQLNQLVHILVHDDEHIHLKTGKESSVDGYWVGDFVKQSTQDRLQKLAEKYREGIWCEHLPDVYRQEYGIDLEYNDLGYNSIPEFVAVLPNIFKLMQAPNNGKYKVIGTSMSLDTLSSLASRNPVENATTDVQDGSRALPSQSSSKVSKRLISKEFMNLDNSVGQINLDIILENSVMTRDVIVSEICNPSLFWIILRRNKPKLITLMDNLQEFYVEQDLDKYSIPPIVLKPGLHIACIYANRWHRGIIKTIELNSVVILLYDYGTRQVYKANQLFFLHKKFSALPAQAITCSLFNIKPIKSNEWSKEAVKKFLDRAIEQEFVARVTSIDRENNRLLVDLIDTSDALDVHITQWMVSNNLAIYGSCIFEKDNLKENNKENEEQEQNLNHVRPAKQLEAVIKYKTRIKLLEKQHQSISNSLEKLDENKTKHPLVLDLNPVDDKKICLNNDNHVENKNENACKFTSAVNSDKQDITNKNLGQALKELQKLITYTKL